MPTDKRLIVVLTVLLALAPWVAIGVMWGRTADAVKAASAAEEKAAQYDARLIGILERLDRILAKKENGR